MKNLYRAALLAALGLLGATAAQAQTTDLLLGFNNAAASSAGLKNDYVIDLGVSSLSTTAYVDFSSHFNATTFASAFGSDVSLANHVAVGVVEGSTAGYPKSLYSTGTQNISAPQFNISAAVAQSPTIGEYASTSLTGWTYFVAASPSLPGTNPSGQSVAQQSGNPMQFLNSGVISETLYLANINAQFGNPTAWTAVGTFDINVNNGTITFTGSQFVPVPEPSTYALFAGAGLLTLAVRRQLNRKNA